MKRESLDIHDKRPQAMQNYLNYYGWHFNKKMCEFALSLMKHKDKKVQTKEKIEENLKIYGIKIDNDILYDKVYVANMLRMDYFENGIPNEKELTKAIKSYLDDEDGYDTKAFAHFYIDTIKLGIPIDWDDVL